MIESVYSRVLGADLDLLPPELRAAFAEGRRVGRGIGVFEVAGTRLRVIRPVLRLLARQRVLFPEYGTDIPFEIVNRPTAEGTLEATRTFHFPGSTRVLKDTLEVVDGSLHDFMGRRGGFEVEMQISVVGDTLQMRSARQWMRAGRLRLRIPPLARVSATESWLGRRRIDIRLHSPILGTWFRYAGGFDYEFLSQ